MELDRNDWPGADRSIAPATAPRPTGWPGRRWHLALILAAAIYAGLPFLAPLLMQLGWLGPARFLYAIYALQCHQLPQRSFFLFGPKLTYSLAEIQAAWQNSFDPLILRQFVGNPQMGWKVAWSDRMVAMYASVPLAGLLWLLLRRGSARQGLPIPAWLRLPWWGFALLLLPLALDGGTHLVSDLAGIGQGFRDRNAWLAALTGNALPAGFYAGDGLYSFNSWMRLASGILFGWGLVWFGFAYLEEWADQWASLRRAALGPQR